MPALAAICYNPDLRAKYGQLVAQGKPRKVAVVAVMRKLLVLANVEAPTTIRPAVLDPFSPPRVARLSPFAGGRARSATALRARPPATGRALRLVSCCSESGQS